VSRPVRVLMVDDQPLVRAGLRVVLSVDPAIEIVGECADGRDALERLPLLPADLVVMDVRMPGMDGAEATRRLRERPGAPPVLVLTTFGDEEVLSAALRAGAAGFVLKDAPGEDILRAVRTVAAGGAWLDPGVTGLVLSAYRASDRPTDQATAAAIGELTARELDVLRLIGRGATNEQIAAELIIGEGTVKTHVGRIFEKLGLRHRAAAVVFAFDHGVVRPRA
jgi:DNA-binding NarL/FixJ family response regulator